MSTRPGPLGPPQVTVVESPSCHYCAEAHRALRRLADDGYVFDVSTVDVRDGTGQQLMRRHGAGMSPLVLVDGSFFSQGRLSRRRLARHLHRAAATLRTPTGG